MHATTIGRIAAVAVLALACRPAPPPPATPDTAAARAELLALADSVRVAYAAAAPELVVGEPTVHGDSAWIMVWGRPVFALTGKERTLRGKLAFVRGPNGGWRHAASMAPVY